MATESQLFIAALNDLKHKVIVTISERLHYKPDVHTSYVSNGNTRGCGCAACVAKYEYTSAAKALHRVKKRTELVYEVMESLKPSDAAYLQQLEEKVALLRAHYHKIKDEIEKLQQRSMV